MRVDSGMKGRKAVFRVISDCLTEQAFKVALVIIDKVVICIFKLLYISANQVLCSVL